MSAAHNIVTNRTAFKNKDQLSLANPRDALYSTANVQVDGQCDKLATELSRQFQLSQLHLIYPTCIWRLSLG